MQPNDAEIVKNTVVIVSVLLKSIDEVFLRHVRQTDGWVKSKVGGF